MWSTTHVHDTFTVEFDITVMAFGWVLVLLMGLRLSILDTKVSKDIVDLP